jgi:enamine deaminase RidA (YjgF/YER057c/UK114 family)
MTEPTGAQARFDALGVKLPVATPPRPTIVTARRVGDLLFLSGRGPTASADDRTYSGKVGHDLDLAQAKDAARACALNLLSAVHTELGSFDEVAACVKVVGIVNCAPGFTRIGDVIDGCSELLLAVFGDDIGRHARTTMGAAELPNDYAVAIELIVAVRPVSG